MDLITVFKKHIYDLFPEDAEFVSDGAQKIRIRFRMEDEQGKQRNSQAIILIFDVGVAQAYLSAEKKSEIEILERYKYSLRRLVVNSLVNYDPNGPFDVAHRIAIDDRALDL